MFLPNLDYFKTQAKALLKAFRAADPQAWRRVEAHLPRFVQPSPTLRRTRTFVLADALHIVARESGFPSWMKLKACVETLRQGKPLEAWTSHLPGGVAAARGKEHGSQAQTLRVLAERLVTLAMLRDSAGLAGYFSRMPRRDGLAVRELVVEQGKYSVLVEGLLDGLSDLSPKVRYECAHALDLLADERCVEPLRRLLDDPVPRVRRVALHTLSCDACKLNPLPMEDDLVACVIDHALKDPSINVRRHAASALGNFCADPRAGLALETLLAREGDRAILREARRALRRRQAASQE